MHPRQTISFLLLFVEFRNQTEQNNARSSRLGRGPLGCSEPQGRKDGFSAHARATTGTQNTQTRGQAQTIRHSGTLGQSRGGDAGTSSPGVMVARLPTTTRADDRQGTLFPPNTYGAACSFTAVARRRAFLSVSAPLSRGSVMHGAHWAARTAAGQGRAPLRLGSPHSAELRLKPGGRTGSGSCLRFMTFSRQNSNKAA